MSKISRKVRRIRLVACCLLGCMACLGVQRFVFNYLTAHSVNFVSPIHLEITMIRLQNIHKLKGDAIMMGSSLTERLRSGDKTAVLGIPGNSFVAGLDLMKDVVEFAPGTTYILEINNILNHENELISEDVKKWHFRAFRGSPHLSIAAKPSNLLLSCINWWINSGIPPSSPIDENAWVSTPENLSAVGELTEDELKKWGRVMDGMRRIWRAGGRICLVRLPEARETNRYQSTYEGACKLAKYMNVPVINYNTDDWRARLQFTDSIHLNSRAASTATFREIIARDAKRCAR